MYKIVCLFAVIAASSAQVLKISPLTLGSTNAAELQTINLLATQRLAARPIAVAAAPQIAYAAPRIAYAAPQVAYAAPQVAYAAPQVAYAAPRIAIAPQIARAAYVNPGLEGPPEPYTFGFQSSDEYGTQLSRQEQADGSGAVTGSYSLAEADGRQRVVQYIADAGGFRATVQTNEPGTANANPADVVIQSSAPSRR